MSNKTQKIEIKSKNGKIIGWIHPEGSKFWVSTDFHGWADGCAFKTKELAIKFLRDDFREFLYFLNRDLKRIQHALKKFS